MRRASVGLVAGLLGCGHSDPRCDPDAWPQDAAPDIVEDVRADTQVDAEDAVDDDARDTPPDPPDAPDDGDTLDVADAPPDLPEPTDADATAGDATDIGARCGGDADCAPGSVCGRAGLCVAARPAVGTGFAVFDEAARLPWPFEHSARGPGSPIAERSCGALVDLPDGSVGWFVCDPAGGSDHGCAFAWSPAGPEVIPRLCDPSWTDITAVAALRAPDGQEVLALGSEGRAWAVEAATGALRVELLDLLDADDARRACLPNLISPIDLNMDGLLDLYLECAAPEFGGALDPVWFEALAGGGGGRFVPREVDDAVLGRWSHRLAHGVVDLDDDGLLDLVLINDSLSSPTVRLVLSAPGALLRRCSPLEDCVYDPSPLLAGNAQWGSFMGAAMVDVDSFGSLMVVTDQGPTHAIEPVTQGDYAAELGIGLGRDEGPPLRWLYAWSPVVEDFDLNGLDDILLTRGSPVFAELQAGTAPAQPNVLMLQSGGGRFEVDSDAAWQGPGAVETSRGALSADLNHDGRLEVLVHRWGNAPVTLERDAAGWCTLLVVQRVVAAHNAGIATGPTRIGPWRVEAMQGQSGVMGSNRVVVPTGSGWVRFASGAVAPYDCGPGVEVRVEEPDWIELIGETGRVCTRLDGDAWPTPPVRVEGAARNAVGFAAPLRFAWSIDRWCAPVLALPDAVMIQIDGRWVGVWIRPRSAP